MVNVYVYNDDPLPAFLEIVRVLKPNDYFSFNSALQPKAKTKSYRTISNALIKFFDKLDLRIVFHDQYADEDGDTRDICLLKKDSNF